MPPVTKGGLTDEVCVQRDAVPPRPRGFENENDNTVDGIARDAVEFSPLPVRAEYGYSGQNDLDASVQDVACTGMQVWRFGRAPASRAETQVPGPSG